jgi:hypothetical protein
MFEFMGNALETVIVAELVKKHCFFVSRVHGRNLSKLNVAYMYRPSRIEFITLPSTPMFPRRLFSTPYVSSTEILYAFLILPTNVTC